jgi:CheY-like chemotaxis protein
VLDEDQQTRDMLREYLEGQGMHVIAVANGTELRQLVAQEPIDAVILDVMARGEDSLGLLREMAEQPGTPPVMLLSAVASDIDRIVGLELGADDYWPSRSTRANCWPACASCCAVAMPPARALPPPRCSPSPGGCSIPRSTWCAMPLAATSI